MKAQWQRFIDFTRTLRFRLTVWNAFVVFITVMIALIAVREGLRSYLVLETDAVLDDSVKEIILDFEQFYFTNDEDHEAIKYLVKSKHDAHEDRRWYVRWMGEDGVTTLWESEDAPPIDQNPGVEMKGKGYKVYASNTHRTIEREIESRGIPRYKIRVGTRIEFIDEDVERLTNVLAPVGIAILILAPIGGLVLADRAIEPLQKLIKTTERLRPSHLEERVELRGVGDELDQLAGKINTLLDQIADHVRKNREFVANAAHDLRSPLAAIQSSVEVTLEKPRSVEEYEELLFQINDEVHHLGGLVNQLLQLAESDSATSEMTMEPVRLSEIAQKTIEMFEPIADERGVKLKLQQESDIVVMGLTGPLKRVLTNLVDNAIKFSTAGGVVTVLLAKDMHHYGQGILSVSDTGIGIPDESLDRVFDRFYQVEKSRARFGEKRGNGLGLSICQSIIHSLRGTISVTSKINQGSTFTITLPLARKA